MWAFGGSVRSLCNVGTTCLAAAVCNIPVCALVSTCVRTLLHLRAIPWCAYVSLLIPFRVLLVVAPLYSLCKRVV